MADLKARGVDLKNVSFERRNVFVSDLDDRTWSRFLSYDFVFATLNLLIDRDRIHVGASCPQKHKHSIYELLRPGGVVVMPLGNHLIRAEKDENGALGSDLWQQS